MRESKRPLDASSLTTQKQHSPHRNSAGGLHLRPYPMMCRFTALRTEVLRHCYTRVFEAVGPKARRVHIYQALAFPCPSLNEATTTEVAPPRKLSAVNKPTPSIARKNKMEPLQESHPRADAAPSTPAAQPGTNTQQGSPL